MAVYETYSLDENQKHDCKATSMASVLARCMGENCITALRGRQTGTIASPFRVDRHPSFCIFFDRRSGIYRFKDWSTGETGTNYDIVRLSYPNASEKEVWNLLAGFCGYTPDIGDRFERRSVKRPDAPAGGPPAESEYCITVDKVCESYTSYRLSGTGPDGAPSLSQRRGVSPAALGRHTRQVVFSLPGASKPVYGIGLRTVSGSWELRYRSIDESRRDALRELVRPLLPDAGAALAAVAAAHPDVTLPEGLDPSDTGALFEAVWGHPVRPGKRSAGAKAHSYITPAGANVQGGAAGCTPTPEVVVFEGMFDFLAWMQWRADTSPAPSDRAFLPPSDVIILNSTGQLASALPDIFASGRTRVHAFFDNDRAGDEGMFILMEECAERGVGFHDCMCSYSFTDTDTGEALDIRPEECFLAPEDVRGRIAVTVRDDMYRRHGDFGDAWQWHWEKTRGVPHEKTRSARGGRDWTLLARIRAERAAVQEPSRERGTKPGRAEEEKKEEKKEEERQEEAPGRRNAGRTR